MDNKIKTVADSKRWLSLLTCSACELREPVEGLCYRCFGVKRPLNKTMAVTVVLQSET